MHAPRESLVISSWVAGTRVERSKCIFVKKKLGSTNLAARTTGPAAGELRVRTKCNNRGLAMVAYQFPRQRLAPGQVNSPGLGAVMQT